MDRWISFFWISVLVMIVLILSLPETRDCFAQYTRNHPYSMGFIKIAILGTMGELLGGKIATGKWRVTGIRLHQRILVWGFLGMVFTVVFPLFSFGVDGLIKQGLLPGNAEILSAFWKSFFMNMIFAFPMMSFHRFTDTLIERGELFSRWQVVEVFTSIHWKNMFRIVGFACIWFWIPAHTITFLLPPEFRVVSAALLAVVLGFILGLAKKISSSVPS